MPLGEVDEGDATFLLRSQGQFINLDEIRNLVVLTKDGVPVYMRDIAEVRDSTEDRSVYIERAINNVKEHALLGSILVILIIFAFLRDWRATIIVSTSIPISVIGTFALLYFAGFTLNTMTFGGLPLGIGMIVDAAIV